MTSNSISNPTNRTEIFFVGGIQNEEKDVQKNALALSKKCGETVIPFWNTTWAKNIREWKQLSIVARDFSQRLTTSLSDGNSICIIAHSHGAKLVRESLKGLPSSYKRMALAMVEVYTFGGVTKIPHGYAGKVENYRNNDDLVLYFGEVLWDEKKEGEQFSFKTLSGYGKGHQFIEGYLDSAAKKIQKFKAQNTLNALNFNPNYVPIVDGAANEESKKFTKGLNIEGICRNPECEKVNRSFVEGKGFGAFNLHKIEYSISCPSCYEDLNSISNIWFYQCHYSIDGQKSLSSGKQKMEVQNTIHTLSNTAQKLEGLGECWDYLNFKVWAVRVDKQ